MNEYSLADYATYKVLYALDEHREGWVPKSRFYKAIYLVSHTLLLRDIDICLPWRWYMYGPMVELDHIDPGVYTKEGSVIDKDDEMKERLFYGAEPPAQAPYEIVRAVDNEVKVVCGHKPKLPKLMDLAYRTAPLPFMRVLRAYDDHIKSSMDHFAVSAATINACETLGRSLWGKFPVDRYRPMFGPVLRVAELIKDSYADAGAFEEVKPVDCSKEVRRSMGHGFSRDFHRHLPDVDVRKIHADYISRIGIFDQFAFDKELAYYRSVGRHDSEFYEQEIEKLLG